MSIKKLTDFKTKVKFNVEDGRQCLDIVFLWTEVEKRVTNISIQNELVLVSRIKDAFNGAAIKLNQKLMLKEVKKLLKKTKRENTVWRSGLQEKRENGSSRWRTSTERAKRLINPEEIDHIDVQVLNFVTTKARTVIEIEFEFPNDNLQNMKLFLQAIKIFSRENKKKS